MSSLGDKLREHTDRHWHARCLTCGACFPFPGIRYKAGPLRLILRGDELTLEQLPQRLTCVRTEEV